MLKVIAGSVATFDTVPNDGQAVAYMTQEDAICRPTDQPSNGSDALSRSGEHRKKNRGNFSVLQAIAGSVDTFETVPIDGQKSLELLDGARQRIDSCNVSTEREGGAVGSDTTACNVSRANHIRFTAKIPKSIGGGLKHAALRTTWIKKSLQKPCPVPAHARPPSSTHPTHASMNPKSVKHDEKNRIGGMSTFGLDTFGLDNGLDHVFRTYSQMSAPQQLLASDQKSGGCPNDMSGNGKITFSFLPTSLHFFFSYIEFTRIDL